MNREIIRSIEEFNRLRDWEQFHSPENLAKSIVIEAGELLENYQWDSEPDIDSVKEELADVMLYCIQLALKYEFNIEKILQEKLLKNEAKYPVSQAKGNSKKYTEFKRNDNL